MSGERRAILLMIAAGRITPREGERLLAVAGGAEDAWAWLAVCATAVWLLTAHMDVLARAAVHCAQWIGGVR